MAAQLSSPRVRQSLYLNCESAINMQINLELYASYTYLSMSYYFTRDDVAMKNLARFFLRLSSEERANAENLIQLQKQRGAHTNLLEIQVCEDWESGPKAVDFALGLEKHVNQNLSNLHQLATNTNDIQLCDFLESHYLHDEVKSPQQSGDPSTCQRRFRALEQDLSEYFFQYLTLDD
ncbi:ferritin heavy chain-like [Erinaceus europaeus]|uniref:Ferritin n=1 Tax=Erinaceus europaeus TaxID=9365 RepID=A0ABM3WS40_ERIEU|nr:ferritin heavy chain-like [Erinaceus europaeus]